MTKWNKLSEKNPDIGSTVVFKTVIDDISYCFCLRINNEHTAKRLDDPEYSIIYNEYENAYWMPLPEPPNEMD